MALTNVLTRLRGFPIGGGRKAVLYTNAPTGTYATGGHTLTAALLGFKVLDIVLIAPAKGFTPEFDYTNNLMLLYWADYDAVADGALAQVTNATDVGASTPTFRIFAIGV